MRSTAYGLELANKSRIHDFCHDDFESLRPALNPCRNPSTGMPESSFTLRRYCQADEDAAIELWRRTWQLAYPAIDFNKRLDWWRQRWRNDLVPSTTIVMAEAHGQLVGFVTVDPATLDLDQIVVASEAWGTGVAAALLAEAKRISPMGLDLHVNKDNARAIRFYEKQGFTVSAEAMNWRSGAPVLKMMWRPDPCGPEA